MRSVRRPSIVYVVGARPNFVKMAPVVREMRRERPELDHVIVHTGQHYDAEMSAIFFDELGLPKPDHLLGVGSGTHGVQTARALERLEAVLEERPPARGGRARRRQLHARGGARRREARHPNRTSRSRPAELRPHDAGGDQPRARGPVGAVVLHSQPRGGEPPEREGIAKRPRSDSSVTR